MAKVIIIAAVADNGVIGANGRVPWSLPTDLRNFRLTTMGHAVLMGGNTFRSIFRSIGRALPGRHNVVVSRTLESSPDVTVCRSYETALSEARTWARAYPNLQTAWTACQRSDWMLWLLEYQ